ncbi:uncharacterized protein [Hetaerina americana]|uniref:uncharacterized protein n=1 Tax=Hetaerina americana TaxID=62018 RepID=UPI003A7F4818
MSGRDQRFTKPTPPPRKFPDPWTFNDVMKDIYPRLPKAICPNAPRVNLNDHWAELEAWYQAREEGSVDLNSDAVVEALKALQINGEDPDENKPDLPEDDGNHDADDAKKMPDSKSN